MLELQVRAVVALMGFRHAVSRAKEHGRDDRGAVTTDYVLWIGFLAVVGAAIMTILWVKLNGAANGTNLNPPAKPGP